MDGAGDQLTVLLDAPLPDRQRQRVHELSPDIELLEGLTPANLQRAQVIYTNKAPFDPEDAPRLRWVQVNTVGVNQVTGTPLADSGIPIANVRGAYSMAVAEEAFAMLLALTRHLHVAHKLQTERRWQGDLIRLQGDDCYGKTVGIVGYGSVGRQIARIAQAMGMRVLACKRRPEQHADTNFHLPNTGDPDGSIPDSRWFGTDEVAEMLRLSDVAVVTVPYTEGTRDLIGKAELESLPPGAYLINVGRGGVVDEAALLDCLQGGRLAGAGLDVFAEEPLPPDSPLWDAPNVIIMPHVGSYSAGAPGFAAEVLIENLARELSGRPLVNVVDFSLGY